MSKVGQLFQLAGFVAFWGILIAELVKRSRNRAKGVDVPASRNELMLVLVAMIVNSFPGAMGMDGRVGLVTAPVSIAILFLALSRRLRRTAPQAGAQSSEQH